MQDIDQKVEAGDVEGAKELCRNTRGPVASICYQGLMHIDEQLDDIERSVSGYGTVQAANLEKDVPGSSSSSPWLLPSDSWVR